MIQKSCNASCLTDSTVGISDDICMLWHIIILLDRLVVPSPSTLRLYYPAKRISNDSDGCGKPPETNF